MKVLVIRPASYTYKLKGTDLYDSYNKLARNHDAQTKVTMLDGGSPLFSLPVSSSTTILTGTLSRCIKTGKLIAPHFNEVAEQKAISVFNEIEYDMQELLSKKQFESKDPASATNLARLTFFRKLASNQLSVPFTSVVERANAALDCINHSNSSQVIVVSNSFFMKVLESVVISKQNATKLDSKSFLEFYDGSKIAYKFLHGFSFSINNTIIGEYKV